MFLEPMLMSMVSGVTKNAADVVARAVADYLRKKGEKVPEAPTGAEIASSLAALDARESSTEAVADVQSIFNASIDQLSTFRGERERQARTSYNLACGVLVVGSLIVLGGVGWMIIGGAVTSAVITSAVGAITSLCSGAIFKLAKEANDRLDAIATDLNRIESTRMSLEIVKLISNEKDRDAAIQKIIANLQTQTVIKPRPASSPRSGKANLQTST